MMLRKTLGNFALAKSYLAVTAIAFVLFYPSWIRLLHAWLEFEQVLAHGLATAAMFIGLLLIHPPQIPATTKTLKPYRLHGAIALIITTLAWVLLELVRIDTLAYLVLPAGLIFVSWAILGLAQTLGFLPYVLLLSLSLPVWSDLVPALVDLASIVVGSWVGWFGMTALIEGNSITLPYGRLIIADGCSGIRYFAISILLAMTISILNDYRWRDWLLTLVIAMTLALIANWVRISVLVVVAYETDMQSDMLTDHDAMGWIVYGLFILPALYFSPVRRRKSAEIKARPANILRTHGIGVIIAALAIGPLALAILQKPGPATAPWTVELPGTSPVQLSDLPIKTNLPDRLTVQAWQADKKWIVLAQSEQRSPDDKLVPYLPTLHDRSVWQLQEEYRPGLERYRNLLTRKQVVVGKRYLVGSRQVSSYTHAKLMQIPALLGNSRRFALLMIQAPCNSRDCDTTRQQVHQTLANIQVIR